MGGAPRPGTKSVTTVYPPPPPPPPPLFLACHPSVKIGGGALTVLYGTGTGHSPGRSKYYEQTGSEPSTALFSPARSSLTSWVPTYYTPLVKPIHGLILAFFPVGWLFGTRRISMGARVSVRVVPYMTGLAVNMAYGEILHE